MKKKIFALLLSLNIFAQAADNQEQKNLVVGTASGYAPYVSLNEKGEYEGFDIDVARALAEKLGKKLVIKDCGSMPSLLLALKQGKVDTLIWAISITDERMKNMEMVYYQGEKVTEMPFLFWNQIPEGIKSIEDLSRDSKKIVCVEAGTFQEDVLKNLPAVNLKYVDKITDVIMEIKYGKSFAAPIDPSLVGRFKAQYPQIKVINLPLPLNKHSLGNGICIDKTNQALAAEVKKAIEALTKEEKISELEKKWRLK